MKHLTLFVLLLLVFAVSLSAQTTSGSMSGSVIDASGQVVPGANVTLVHERSLEQREGVTNDVGDFAFAGLAPGPYTIRVTLTGFKPLESRGNVVISKPLGEPLGAQQRWRRSPAGTGPCAQACNARPSAIEAKRACS